MDKRSVKGIIYGVQVIGLCCFGSSLLAAADIHLKFSAQYALPSGISQAIPMVRLCDQVNKMKRFSRLFMASALAPSETLSQGIFFPSTTDFISPGVALRNGKGTTYYAYCAEQVRYRELESKRLDVTFGTITKEGSRYKVDCKMRIKGGR